MEPIPTPDDNELMIRDWIDKRLRELETVVDDENAEE